MAAKAKAKAAKASGESVLLEEAHLHQAFKEVTRGGRQNLHGIYTPKGRIPDNAEAEENQNLAKVADKYKAKKKQVKQKAKEAKKSETEFEDERVSKKAAKILSKASEVEKSQYQEIFNYFDADEDACWGSIELAQRMTDLGYATSVEAASNLLYFAGVRDVDRITYEDFITMMPKLQAFRKLMEKDFMCHFQRKDDGTGHISSRQLQEMLLQLAGPEALDETQMAEILKKSDPTREGRVTFENMILALFGSRPLLPYQPPTRTKSLVDSIIQSLGQLCGSGPPKASANYVGDVAPPLPA
mmetsp:Transcript_37022/g.60819  ORF Transcript_37022/g.60819 Transcript_37022/m.60819 type:complete len:300 (+) Transcript_37022:56-955(+)